MPVRSCFASITVATLLVSTALSRSATVENTGTIKGRLVWAAGPIPEPKVVDPDQVKDPICRAKPIVTRDINVDPATSGVADAIAYLIKPAGDYSEAEKALIKRTPEVVVEVVNCQIVPPVSVVHRGQKLTIKSSDQVGHDLHTAWKYGNATFPGSEARYKELVGHIQKEVSRPSYIVCSFHFWMKSYVRNFEHPFGVVTKADGSFELTGVPAGEQHLIVWQARKGYVNEGLGKGLTVTVPAGGVADLGKIEIKK
jgi:hypothetical protein